MADLAELRKVLDEGGVNLASAIRVVEEFKDRCKEAGQTELVPSAVPPLRGAAPVSSTASIGKGLTVIATSAVSQLDGLAISQI